jgi:hypothetical protein
MVIRHIFPEARHGIDVDHGFYVFEDPLEFLFGRAEKARMDYLQEAQRVLLRKGFARCRGNIGSHIFLYRRRMTLSEKQAVRLQGGKYH